MKTPFFIITAVLLAIFSAGQNRAAAAASRAPGGGESLAAIAFSGKIEITTIGTGKSIGHVADLRIRNLTEERIAVPVPAMVLESGSRQYQHYACPHAQTVIVGPHGTKTVPIDGICLVRDKPPVGKGVTGELIICDGNPSSPRAPDSHFTAKEAGKLTRVAKSYADAAEKLEQEGAFKNMPYHKPKERKEIATQLGVWSDTKIAKITHSKRMKREDFKRTIVRQAEEKKPVGPEEKKQLEQGADDIFKDIQLTSKEAKNLEEPDPFQNVELTGPKAKSEG